MLADRGTMAILLVEQYYDFAAELADQYLVMERGEFIARGGRFANINRPIAGPRTTRNCRWASTRCSCIRWARPTA
jgi:ABC-type multidrug transport system ATPase subunit